MVEVVAVVVTVVLAVVVTVVLAVVVDAVEVEGVDSLLQEGTSSSHLQQVQDHCIRDSGRLVGQTKQWKEP